MAVLRVGVSRVLQRASILAHICLRVQQRERWLPGAPGRETAVWMARNLQRQSAAFSELVSVELNVPRPPECLYL